MTLDTRRVTSGRGWAYTGAVLGGLVSIAANVAHSFIPPKGAPADWAPEPGAVVGAIVWPVFLFIAVEILARVAWPKGLSWQILRWAGMLPVAVVAAFVSYRHLSGLLAHYGEEPIVTWLGPLAVDGLMVMATGALLATGRHHNTNITPSTVDIATVPAVPRPAPAAPSTLDTPPIQSEPPTAPALPAPVPVPTPAQVAARITPPRPAPPATPDRVDQTASTHRPRPAAAAAPAPRLAPPATDSFVTAQGAAQLALPIADPQPLDRARQVARQYHADHGTRITAGQLAARLKVNSDQAAHLLNLLTTDTTNPNTPVATVNGNRPAKAAR